MDKLIKLHDKVKNHSFRLNHKKGKQKEYRELLYQLVREFDKKTNELLPDRNLDLGYLFHEQFSLVMALDYYEFDKNLDELHYKESLNPFKVGEIMAAIETTIIQQIHQFINTKKIDKFTTFYHGCNDAPWGRWNTYVWNPKKKEYENISYKESGYKFNKETWKWEKKKK